jgi:hypothetical protein
MSISSLSGRDNTLYTGTLWFVEVVGPAVTSVYLDSVVDMATSCGQIDLLDFFNITSAPSDILIASIAFFHYAPKPKLVISEVSHDHHTPVLSAHPRNYTTSCSFLATMATNWDHISAAGCILERENTHNSLSKNTRAAANRPAQSRICFLRGHPGSVLTN